MSGQPPEQPYGQPYGQPTDPHGRPLPDPYGQTPYSQNPYGQNPYGQDPNTQDPYGQPAQQPYGAVPFPSQTFPQVTPDHPSATTAMILGIVGLVGGFMLCGLPLVVSPFAWATGSRVVKEIDASNGQLGGRDQAMVGKVLGIVGTILLIIAVVSVVVFLTAVMTSDTFTYEEY